MMTSTFFVLRHMCIFQRYRAFASILQLCTRWNTTITTKNVFFFVRKTKKNSVFFLFCIYKKKTCFCRCDETKFGEKLSTSILERSNVNPPIWLFRPQKSKNTTRFCIFGGKKTSSSARFFFAIRLVERITNSICIWVKEGLSARARITVYFSMNHTCFFFRRAWESGFLRTHKNPAALAIYKF